MASNSGYGTPNTVSQMKVVDGRDDRDDNIAQDVPADLHQDLVAEQDRPRAARCREQPVQRRAHPGHVGHEIGGQHQHDEHGGERAENGLADTENPGCQARSRAVQELLDVVLDVEALVELTEQWNWSR